MHVLMKEVCLVLGLFPHATVSFLPLSPAFNGQYQQRSISTALTLTWAGGEARREMTWIPQERKKQETYYR